MSAAEFHSEPVQERVPTPEEYSDQLLKATLNVLEKESLNLSVAEAYIAQQSAKNILTKDFSGRNTEMYELLRSSAAGRRSEGYALLAKKILSVNGKRAVTEERVAALAEKLDDAVKNADEAGAASAATALEATAPLSPAEADNADAHEIAEEAAAAVEAETKEAPPSIEPLAESPAAPATENTDIPEPAAESPLPHPDYQQAVDWLKQESSLKNLQYVATKIDDEWLPPEDIRSIDVAHLYLKAVKENPEYTSPAKKADRMLDTVVGKFTKLLKDLDAYRADEKQWRWRWSFASKYDRETKPVPPEIIDMRIERFKEVADRLIPGEIDDEKWSFLKTEMRKDEYNFADQWSTAQANIRLVQLLSDHLHLTGENNTVFMVSYFDSKYAPKELVFPPKLPEDRTTPTEAALAAPAASTPPELPAKKQGWIEKTLGFFGRKKQQSDFGIEGEGVRPENTLQNGEIPPHLVPETIDQSTLSSGKKEMLKAIGWGTVGAVTSIALSIAGVDRQTQTVLGWSFGSGGYLMRLATAVKVGETVQNAPDGIRKRIAGRIFDAIGTTIGETKWLTALLTGYTIANISPVGEMAAAEIHALGQQYLGGAPEVAIPTSSSPTDGPRIGEVDLSNPLLASVHGADTNPKVGEVDLSNPLLGGHLESTDAEPRIGEVDLNNPALGGHPDLAPEAHIGEVDLSNPLLGGAPQDAESSPKVGEVDLTNPLLGSRPDSAADNRSSDIDLNNPSLGPRPEASASEAVTLENQSAGRTPPPHLDARQPDHESSDQGRITGVPAPDSSTASHSSDSDLSNPSLGARPEITAVEETSADHTSPRLDGPQLDPGSSGEGETASASVSKQIKLEQSPLSPEQPTSEQPQPEQSRPAPPIGPTLSPPETAQNTNVTDFFGLTSSHENQKDANADAADFFGMTSPHEHMLPEIEPTKLQEQYPWFNFTQTLQEHQPAEISQGVDLDQRVDPIKDVFNALNTYAFGEKGYDPNLLHQGDSVLVLTDEFGSVHDVRALVEKQGIPVIFSQEQLLRLDEYVTAALLEEKDSRTTLQTFVVERLNAHTQWGGAANEIYPDEFLKDHFDKLEQLYAIALGKDPAADELPSASEAVPAPQQPELPTNSTIPAAVTEIETPLSSTNPVDTDRIANEAVAQVLANRAQSEPLPPPQPISPTDRHDGSGPTVSEVNANENDASVPVPEQPAAAEPHVLSLETTIDTTTYGENAPDIITILKKAGWDTEEPEKLAWLARRSDALLDSNDGRLNGGSGSPEGFSPARRLWYELAHSDVSPHTNEAAQKLLDRVVSETGDFSNPDDIFGSLNRNLAVDSEEGLLAYTTYLLERNDFSTLEGALSYWFDGNNLPEGGLPQVIERLGFVDAAGAMHSPDDLLHWFDQYKEAVLQYKNSNTEADLTKVQELFSQFTAIEQPFSSANYIRQLIQ